ncbi:GNAZ protein, partial [Polypterus senegalus]
MTTGIVENKFTFKELTFKMVDIGVQCSERKNGFTVLKGSVAMTLSCMPIIKW